MADFNVGDRVEITGWDVHGVLPEDRVNGLHGTVGSVPKNGPYYRVDLDKPPEFARRGLYCKPDELLPEAPAAPSIPRDVFKLAIERGLMSSYLSDSHKAAVERVARRATDSNKGFMSHDHHRGPGCPLTQAGVYAGLRHELRGRGELALFYVVYDPIIRAYFRGTGLPATPDYFRIED